jgi:hypothetical protein
MSLTYKNRAVTLVFLIASSILWVSGCVGVAKAAPSQPPNSGVTLVTVAPSKASSVTSGTLAFIATMQGTSSNTSVRKTLKGLSTTDANLYKRTSPNGYTYLENCLNGMDNNESKRISQSRDAAGKQGPSQVPASLFSWLV